MTEPTATALLVLAVGVLLMLSALGTRVSRRTGLPLALIFLGVGILAGSEGIGGIEFENYTFAFRVGTVALALILFDGGLNTSLDRVKRWYKPAALLATLGVLLTAALVAVAARLMGFSWSSAALLGAVVSSTDAAAVFAALRASGVQLKKRVGLTLELESGLNDPMAFILTVGVTNAIAAQDGFSWSAVAGIPIQIGVGAAAGLGIGALGRLLVRKARLSVGGLYPVMTVAVALVGFSVPTLLQGSGFLAVYLAGMVLGDGQLPYRSGLLRVHDAIAWFAQVGMFLMLGLLVFPSELPPVAIPGIALALILAVVVRPLAVAACVLPFRFPRREVVYLGWVGLRGAVPIILATFPVLAGVEGARTIFNLVFFIVIVNVLVPGASLGWVTRRLGLESRAPEAPSASLEIASTHDLNGEIVAYHIGAPSAVAGQRLSDVPFPPAAAAMLIIRGRDLIAPRGATVLQPGDHVYVFCRHEDRSLIQLLFGQEESD